MQKSSFPELQAIQSMSLRYLIENRANYRAQLIQMYEETNGVEPKSHSYSEDEDDIGAYLLFRKQFVPFVVKAVVEQVQRSGIRPKPIERLIVVDVQRMFCQNESRWMTDKTEKSMQMFKRVVVDMGGIQSYLKKEVLDYLVSEIMDEMNLIFPDLTMSFI